jgi:hypothetical protein
MEAVDPFSDGLETLFAVIPVVAVEVTTLLAATCSFFIRSFVTGPHLSWLEALKTVFD